MSSRPITPISPNQSAYPDPSTRSARPTSASISSRPVSYVGTQYTRPIDGVSQPNHSQAALQDHSAVAQAPNLHDEVVDQNQNQIQESSERPRPDFSQVSVAELVAVEGRNAEEESLATQERKHQKGRQQEKQLCWLSPKPAARRKGKVRGRARNQQRLLQSCPDLRKPNRAPCKPLPRYGSLTSWEVRHSR